MLLTSAVASAGARLRGLVLDGNRPLSTATVQLKNATEEVQTITDTSGRFTMFALSGGRWELSVRRVGYAPYADSVNVGTDDSEVIVPMKRNPLELDTMRVVAEGHAGRLDTFRERQRRAATFGGNVYGREQLASSDASQLTDFLRRVPGVTISSRNPNDKSISFRRCATSDLRDVGTGAKVRLFINGAQVRSDPMEALSLLGVSEIEALEVYQGVSQLPPEVTDGCSAIFVWTRSRVGGDSSKP